MASSLAPLLGAALRRQAVQRSITTPLYMDKPPAVGVSLPPRIPQRQRPAPQVETLPPRAPAIFNRDLPRDVEGHRPHGIIDDELAEDRQDLDLIAAGAQGAGRTIFPQRNTAQIFQARGDLGQAEVMHLKALELNSTYTNRF